MRKVCYGSIDLDQGERWPKVAEQIDGLARDAPGAPLYFDVMCSRADRDEAVKLAERTYEYALSKGLAMDEPPYVTVR
jgi:hypothetical protein